MGPNRIITIGADDASLAGHFPGHLVVPGVVMRGEILHVMREMARDGQEDHRICGHAVGEVSVDDQSLEFTCTTGSRLIANGCLCYCTAACNAGTMLLASVFKTPVALFFGLYRAGVRYEVHFELFAEEVTIDRNQRDLEVQQWTQRYADRLEYYCRMAADNGFNFYDFWEEQR